MTEVLIRPMRVEDVPTAERITAEGYHELDLRTFERSWPDPTPRTPQRGEAWIRRTTAIVEHDGPGCWVAETDGRMVGIAVSHVQELMWVLASFAVLPTAQGRGVGRQLLDAALGHGRGCLRGLLAASADPLAVRRYRLAGFSLHPQMFGTGVVDRAAIPVVRGVREGTSADRDLLNSIDRQTRGAAHDWLHDLLAEQTTASGGRLMIVERSTGHGYAYVDGSGSPSLLAATTRRLGADLLWECLASAPTAATTSVRHVTAANQWAVDVAIAARLSVHTSGYLGTRAMKPPRPYLHHGSLL